MVVDTIKADIVKNKWKSYKYALIYMVSELIFRETQKIEQINWEECQEAYFFDETGQIHVFQNEEGTLSAVCFTEPSEANIVKYRYQIAHQFVEGKTPQLLKVHEYLEQDTDGQVVVAYTRLVSIEEGDR